MSSPGSVTGSRGLARAWTVCSRQLQAAALESRDRVWLVASGGCTRASGSMAGKGPELRCCSKDQTPRDSPHTHPRTPTCSKLRWWAFFSTQPESVSYPCVIPIPYSFKNLVPVPAQNYAPDLPLNYSSFIIHKSALSSNICEPGLVDEATHSDTHTLSLYTYV